MVADLTDIIMVAILFIISLAISIYRMLRPGVISALVTIAWLGILDAVLWVIDRVR